MTELFQQIQKFDEWLLLLVNRQWTAPFFDWFFPFITDLNRTTIYKICAPLLLFFALVAFYKKRGVYYFAVIFFTMAACDWACNLLIKKNVQRLRPPDAGVDIILRTDFHAGYSFTSNHASNIFCSMTFLSLLFPKKAKYFLTVAFLVAYSRMYVGVRYPTDVICGALLGVLFAQIFYRLAELLRKRKFPNV